MAADTFEAAKKSRNENSERRPKRPKQPISETSDPILPRLGAFIMVGYSPKSGISRVLNSALKGLYLEFSNFGQKNGLSRPRLSA
ncbi:MAG: hypothetical protein CBC23_004495 [Rhodospirillaceae bacterium TMED63]|nr:MAG: hypothetical protein CBC23_004495 [Rhodospirillaceae bacterium TMED63]